MQKTFTHSYDKILVFPITDTNQEIYEMQQISYEKINESIIIRLDPNEWINFSMIIKLKEYEEVNRKDYDDFVLFSRPLIKDLLKELLQILLNLKSLGYYILAQNLEEVWIKFQIQKNHFDFKKLIVLGQIVKSNDQTEDCKIIQLIQPILNFYNAYDDKKLICSYLYEKIEVIKRQYPYGYYQQQFRRNYKQTNLNQFKYNQIGKLHWIDTDDDVFRNTLINEHYYYRLPLDDELLIQIQSKYQFIKDEIKNYLKQFDYFFKQLSLDQSQQIIDSITKIIKNKIQIRGYTNYVSSFMQLTFEVTNFIEKQEVFYIFFSVIQQLDDQIKSFCLMLLLDDGLINKSNYKQNQDDKQYQLQKSYDNYYNELKSKVEQQLRNFYQQIQNTIQLNQNIEDQIFQHMDLDLILNSLCGQLKSSWAEWDENKDLLIKKAIISQQQIIKEAFFKSISIYVQTL